jgi:hypothetical protein
MAIDRWCASLASLILLYGLPALAVPPPPPELKELVDEGHVRFQFYDPRIDRYERPGITRFFAAYKWTFRFDVRSRKQGDELRVTVLPKFDRIEVELDHVIHLPKHYDNEALFQRSLVLHEFDHVAISSDPRPRRLVEHLVRKLTVVERLVDVDQPVNESLAREIVNDELARREEAVRALIDFNNRRLDQLSAHGNRDLEDRKQFFATLYTRENLEAAKFLYLREVADLLRRPDFTNVELARKKALRPQPRSAQSAAQSP